MAATMATRTPMPPMPNKEDIVATSVDARNHQRSLRTKRARQKREADASSRWNYLEQGISRIMHTLDSGIDMTTYMGIYTAVHNFCASQRPMAYPQQAISGGLNSGSQKGAHLLGEDLYNRLIEYLTNHLHGLITESKSHTDEPLLSFYIKEWARYTVSAKFIHHLFRYLNRHWVKREIDEGKKNIYDVYTLHLVQWRRVLFDQVSIKVMDAVLRLIERQRNGDTIEHTQIKQVVESFVSLGLDEADPSKSTLDVYRFHFEKPFLDATREFYQTESKQFVTDNSVVEYMKKAEIRLQEEENRVGMYLHQDIAIPLKKCCHQVLISEHAVLMRDEFQSLLDNDREEDMARMYNLLGRIPEGLDPLRQKFETHVRKAGLNAVEKLLSSEGGEKLDPKAYVDALLEVHTHYSGLVKRAFLEEPEFTRSLDNACREFVNRNAVCKAGSSKSPELLAKYTDLLLRKSATAIEEAQLEATLTHIMTVFKYIEDKDVFQTFYSRMLARRLVHSNSSSDDAETSMISKLKEACGFEYTNKLQRMFQDIAISKEMNQNFRKELESSKKNQVDSTYSILGTSFWPLTAPNTSFNPPAEIAQDCERFIQYYKKQHDGRKLTWLWNLCKGEIKANYCRSNAKHIFQVNVYQMGVLLLFNEQDKYTYENILDATQLNPEILEQAMSVILKAKVLIMMPENSGDSKIGPGKSFRLNFDFKSKKLRVKLDIGGVKETKQEEVETNKTIEEDRKLLLQSAMVRIMKARKKMKHNQLVSETITQIKSRFVPKVADIKKCIEILLDKEYLERLDDDELGYLA